MRVLKHGVLIAEPNNVEKKSEGGIILQSEDTYSTVIESKVIAVGEAVVGLEVGDTISHRARAGVQFKHDGVEYRVLTDDDVIAVI